MRVPPLPPRQFFRQKSAMVPTEKLAAFTAWAKAHITGDEKGQAQKSQLNHYPCFTNLPLFAEE